MKKALLILGAYTFLISAALAQTSESRVELDKNTFAREVAKSEDFSYLSDLREDLTRQASETEQNIEQMTTKLSKLGNPPLLQRFIEGKKSELDAAQKAKKDELAEFLRNSIARAEDDMATYKSTSTALDEAKRNLSALMRNRSLVEHRIITLLRDAKDTGTFRWVTSVSFCALVLFVIVGFYVIAWYKDQIAYTIFAGEKGMQFITLFLIVIAIILFGIMGTLEGKELAALLGGLSGYILGRTSSTTPQTDKTTNSTPALSNTQESAMQ
jgi:hypothetical protein